MIKFFKKLSWLLKNQEKIKALVERREKAESEPNYSLAGVPDYQLKYIDDILNDDKVK